MAGSNGESGEFGLQIAPMLDVMFVLLLFFMVSAGGQQKEAELGINLPKGGPGEPSLVLMIDITPAGEVMVNNVNMGTPDDKELVSLAKQLTTFVKSDPKQVVVINPAASATNGRIVAVLSACSEAKVSNIVFGIPK